MHCALSPSLKHYFEGHVLISGIISFTVDNSETQFDERIDDVRQMKGLAAGKKVFVPEVFSSTNGYDSNDKFNKWPSRPFSLSLRRVTIAAVAVVSLMLVIQVFGRSRS